MNGRLACLLLSGVCLAGARVAAQSAPVSGATVDETKVTKTFYVDPSNADAVDDADHGTEESPFRTIGHGVQVAASEQDRGVGAKVVIADGIYREAVRVPAARGNSEAPLVIESANREQAIIEGADAADWEPSSWKQDGPRWVHPWAGAPVAAPAAPAKRSNANERRLPLPGGALVFIGGPALRQVAGVGDLVAGSFCWTPAPAEPKGRRSRAAATGPAAAPPSGTIVLQPASDDGLGGAPEVSVQDRAFTVEGRRNVVIRGLAVQHMAGAAIVVAGCANVLIEDVLSQWNGEAGLRVTGRAAVPWSDGVTLRRVRLLYNGGSGLAASNLKNLVVEDSETSFNGVRALWSDWVDPAGAGGSKVTGIHGGVWRRHRVIGNTARGLWWAGDCTDITVQDTFCRANVTSGLFFENSAGPFVVEHSVITGNKSHPSGQGETASPAAISICAAAGVRLEGNIVAGNDMPQLGLWDLAGRTDAVNFETSVREPHRAEGHRYRRNVFCGLTADQPIFNLPTVDRGGKATFDFYYATLDTDGNCYWNSDQPDAFCSFDKGYVRRPGVSLAKWRAFLTSKMPPGSTPEADSIWLDPLFADAAEGDYRLQGSSPAADWGLLSDEGSPGQ